MVSSSKSSTLLSLTLIFVISFAGRVLGTNNPSTDNNNLVYKLCANQTRFLALASLPPSTLLSSLLQELVEKSSEAKFYETNIGDDATAISGLFQCRGDLSNDECYNCVNKLPKISNTLCGETIPARVQLSGCYVHYELDGATTFQHDLLHKTCGESIGGGSSGFQEILSGAFEALLNCVMSSTSSSSHGYCDMSYESMRVMAQCEGNLGDCECGECVKNAVQVAEGECRDSVSGEIYLESCNVRYIYQPHALPGNSLPGGGKRVGSAELVAIVVGGGAALSSVLVCWFFIRSSSKKRDDDW